VLDWLGVFPRGLSKSSWPLPDSFRLAVISVPQVAMISTPLKTYITLPKLSRLWHVLKEFFAPMWWA
jgi:hypothetical protein